MGAGELLGPGADVAGVLVAEEELFREEGDTEDIVAL